MKRVFISLFVAILICTVAPIAVQAEGTGNIANSSDLMNMPGRSMFQNTGARQQTSTAQSDNTANANFFRQENASTKIEVDFAPTTQATKPVIAQSKDLNRTIVTALIALLLAAIATIVFVLKDKKIKSNVAPVATQKEENNIVETKNYQKTKPKKKKGKKHHR